MPDQPASLLDLERATSESVVHLHGEVDLFNASTLRRCLEELAEAGEQRVVVDMADLGFIDSSGLGALVGGMRRLRRAGGEVVLRSPRGQAAKLLEVTGLENVLPVER
jgi:anti-sigma B factor antagonist